MVDITSSPTVEPEALPGRPYPRLPDEASPQSYGAGIGQSIERAGEVLQDVHNRVQAQARQTQLTDAHNQTQALSLGLTHDPDTGAFTKQGKNAFGLTQQYLPQFDKGVQSIAAQIPDARARQMYLHSVAPTVRQHLSEQLDQHELTQHQEYAGQTAQASIAMAAATAASNYNHPDIMTSNRDTVNFNIDSLAQLKGWSPEQTEFSRQKALTEFHSDVIDAMVGQGHLSQARTYLYAQSARGEIDPKASDGLQRMMLAKEEHDLVMADKRQRDASNAILKNGILLQQQGALTPQFIEKHHTTLEPQAYEYLYGLTSGKTTTTDPRVYAPLLQAALSGQDVSQKAQDALYAGSLKLDDFKTIVEKGEQPRKGYVARGADYIKQALTPNPLIEDPAGHRSLANAMDDWNQWISDHPEATEEQARTSYRNITEHYQLVGNQQATLFNAVPLQLVGSRTEPDIAKTWTATKAAHAAGEMSDAEYNHQAALILQWKKAQVASAPKQKP